MDEKISQLNNEKDILQLKHEYLVFLDESGDSKLHDNIEIYDNPTVYPIFTITALIIKKSDYENILLPEILKMKEKFFGNIDIILHSNEIRRKDRGFKVFLDNDIYNEFKKEIVEIIDKSNIQIVSSSIRKKNLLERTLNYKQSGIDYDFGNLYLKNFEFILERVAHCLNSNKEKGKLIFETVGNHESRKIQKTLDSLKNDGTFYHSNSAFDAIDKEILFYAKKDVVNGLQIVDYLVHPFAKYAKDKTKDNNLYKILLKYIYMNGNSYYGLKIWP